MTRRFGEADHPGPKDTTLPILQRAATRRAPLSGRGEQDWADGRKGICKGFQDGHLPALLRNAVKENTRASAYEPALDDFLDWVQQKKYTVKSIADLDRSLCDFFSELCYLRQLGPGKAQNCRAAILHFCPEWENSLPLSRRALKGYRKLELGQEGEGFSEEVWGLLLQDLNHHSPVAFAILALSLDGYLRGMDWDAMRPDDVSVGIVAGQKRVSIRLGVRERGEATKTGSNKGLVVNREWVAVTIAVLAQQRAAGGHSRLFALSRPEFDAIWKSALQRLNLQWIDTPHAIRHAGATIDHLVYSVPLPEIQKRGRWDCLKSVTRYSKPDILVRGNSRVPTEQLKRGELYLAFLRERLTFEKESHKKRRFN